MRVTGILYPQEANRIRLGEREQRLALNQRDQFMWLRLGRWVELGVHLGTRNRRSELLDRYLVHAAVRIGKSEWYHGPDRPEPSGYRSAHHIRITSSATLYPDPEPFSWGISKVAISASDVAADSKDRLGGASIRMA